MRKYILFILGAAAAFTMISCKDDDGHSLGTSYMSLATVENPHEKPTGFVFTTDGGNSMWVAATGIPSYGPKNDTRILADYSILYDRPESDPYDYYVKLNDYYNVLTKDAVFMDEENGEIANDPISVRKIWVSGGFINIDFVLTGNNKTHYLNLVSNPLADYRDGKTHLDFRHNKNDDAGLLDLRGIISFNPDTVLAEGAGLPLDIVIHWKAPSGDSTYEVSYDKKTNEEASSDKVNMGKAAFR